MSMSLYIYAFKLCAYMNVFIAQLFFKASWKQKQFFEVNKDFVH